MSYKRYIASIAGISPLCPLMERLKKMPRILFYHGVINSPYYDARVQANQIQLEEFEKQIYYLRRNYHIISLDEFYDNFINRKNFTDKDIILTFDDGYKNNLTTAAPFLTQYNIPFTVFIATNLVDTEGFVPTYKVRSAILSPALTRVDISAMHKSYQLQNEAKRIKAMGEIISFIKTNGDGIVNSVINDIEEQFGADNRSETDSHFHSERIMSWDDAGRLKEMGAIIGSHSEDHSILHCNQTYEEIKRQLRDSRDKIIQHIGICRYFAFPNGDKESVCEQSLKLAEEFYEMSFAVTGKSVSWNNSVAYISRIGAAFNLPVLKSQLSILS